MGMHPVNLRDLWEIYEIYGWANHWTGCLKIVHRYITEVSPNFSMTSSDPGDWIWGDLVEGKLVNFDISVDKSVLGITDIL